VRVALPTLATLFRQLAKCLRRNCTITIVNRDPYARVRRRHDRQDELFNTRVGGSIVRYPGYHRCACAVLRCETMRQLLTIRNSGQG